MERPGRAWPRRPLGGGAVRAPAGLRALPPGKAKASSQLPNDFGKAGAPGVSFRLLLGASWGATVWG